MPTRSAIRHALMGLTVSVFMTLLACAVAEAVLRLFGQPPVPPRVMQLFDGPTYYQTDPELGLLPRPSVSGIHPGFNAAFSTNERGLRGAGRGFAVPKPAGTRRVVVLGDSFAWGYGVQDHEIFTEVLARSLENVEVVNLGVIGFNLTREFAYLKREGMRYQPDVVVLAVCQNDIKEPGAPTRQRTAKTPSAAQQTAQPGSIAVLSGVKQFLQAHSRLYALGQKAINSNKALTQAAVAAGIKDEYAGFESLDDNLHAALVEYPPQVERAMQQYQSELLELAAYLREREVMLIVAMIPSLQAVNSNALSASIAYTRYEMQDFDTAKPYRLLQAFCSEHQLLCVEPLARFQEYFRAGESLYLPQDMHFNAAGHRRFAEAIQPVLSVALTRGTATRPTT